jgi:long-chain acyl-CoA synthetase
VYIKSEWLAQVWIHGDSLHDYAIMFGILDPDRLKKFKEETGNDADPSDPKFIQTIYDGLMTLANGAKFNSLEKPKQIRLSTDPWTIENEFLTPTMKMKRNVAKQILAE